MKWIREGVLASSLVVMAGCGALQPVKSTPPNTYALQAQFQSYPASINAPVLLINRPRAQPGFDSPRMAYVRKVHELEYFSRNQWIDTPEKMLTPLLAQAFEASGVFSAVSQSSNITAQLRLDSEIVRLQQEFTTVPSQMHFTLRMQLVDVAGRRIVATREFDMIEQAPSEDPYGGVIAANRAVRRALSEATIFFAAHVNGLAK